jgi:hypothetical protein
LTTHIKNKTHGLNLYTIDTADNNWLYQVVESRAFTLCSAFSEMRPLSFSQQLALSLLFLGIVDVDWAMTAGSLP